VIEYGCDIEGQLIIGRNSRLGAGTVVMGNVVIGDNCIIEPGAFLKDSVIWSNSVVQHGAHVEQTVICSDCVVPNLSRHFGVNHVSAPQRASQAA
ncbi:MAG: NDP-sugar synthase, partial [Candidatus Melainabacteria bacterium]|nr:NDP-sugar synthase [Candidatus Melainabacteria bacterium]